MLRSHLILMISSASSIFALLHLYLWQRLSYYLQLRLSYKLALALVLAALAITAPIALVSVRIYSHEVAKNMAWFFSPWIGFLLLLVATLLLTDLLWVFLYSSLSLTAKFSPERRAALRRTLGASALSATGLLGGMAIKYGLQPATVKPVRITLKRLPKSLDGLRIVQITDLHTGPIVDRAWVQHVVDITNLLKPDLIVITGDLVDGAVNELREDVAPIAELQAPLGVFFVTGNHEYYSGVEEWCSYLTSLGIKVLRNSHQKINIGAESFYLAGVDDYRSDYFAGQGANMSKALAGCDPDSMILLLAHQPIAVEEASQKGIDLQLSGHTHGGQIWPFGYLVLAEQPYLKGLHRHPGSDTQIYVSSGTGLWGPPMRLGTRAEITLLTLRSPVQGFA